MGNGARTILFLALATSLAACVECPSAPGLNSAQCAVAKGLRLSATLRPSPGNKVADDVNAARFGHYVFFDARLSSNGNVRCGTCHLPEKWFADGKPVSEGLEAVTRNSPSVLNSAHLEWIMQDGKADSVWSQPLMAFENEREMNFTRLELAHGIVAFHQARYEAVFGALPDLSDAARFPARAKPGDGVWEAMTQADRDTVDLIVSNVGKALEAYERQLAVLPGRLDAHLDGDEKAFSSVEREGLRVFVQVGCAECHGGPMLTDEKFHALNVPSVEAGVDVRGRAGGLEVLAASEFNRSGRWYEATPVPVPMASAADEGAWRTPSLRNVGRTAPYGHDGVFATLEEVVDFHLPAGVSASDRTALLAFLRAVDASDAPQPWNNWPNR